MNEKAFMRRAQKLTAKAVQTKKILECEIKRFTDGELGFCIIHFDHRYSPYANRRITVYINLDTDREFSNIESFINKLLKGEDALIEKQY